MPVAVSHTVQVRDFRKDDVTTFGKVLGISKRQKWATVTFQGQAAPYDQDLKLDEELTVTRMEPTEEEKEAANRRFRLEELDRRERAAAEVAAQAREQFEKSLGHGLPSASRLEELYVRQYAAACWSRIGHVSKIRAERSLEDESVTVPDRLEVARLVRDKVREEVVNFVRWRPLSRSTSQTSNWIEDCELQAKGAFLEDLQWIISD